MMKKTSGSMIALAGLLLAAGCGTSPGDPGDEVVPGTPPEVGAMAPNFTRVDTGGREVSLDQFRGKVVLLDFWATWCTPCINDLPHIKGLWSKLRAKDFVILSVSLDANQNIWKSFIRQQNLDWVQVIDGRTWSTSVANQYGISAIPSAYLIGRDGKIIARGINGYGISDDTIENAVK